MTGSEDSTLSDHRPMVPSNGGDPSSLLTSLRLRVEELERENARLLCRISRCRFCSKEEDKNSCSNFGVSCEGNSQRTSVEENKVLTANDGRQSRCMFQEISNGERSVNMCQEEEIDQIGEAHTKVCDGKVTSDMKRKIKEGISGCDLMTIHHHAKRYIALKIMYFGQRFYGFASEANMEPTIESEIFKALTKTKLWVGTKEDSKYSRCGRTDKGVSSIGQVISLFVRSNMKDTGELVDYEKISLQEFEEEIDYVRVLNRVLPDDIRVMGWCPVPFDFSARFSCLSREYKYLFWRERLDILAMQTASKKFIGEHDFRNFCKMDAANVKNYKRLITNFDISCVDGRSTDTELWAITIKGSAFLWHQVRCMVAVLFMIGQGLESASVIDALLDISKTPRKPQYVMAPEIPLILQSCEFEDLNFICSPGSRLALQEHLKNKFQDYMLKGAIFSKALSRFCTQDGVSSEHNKKKNNHIPLMLRQTEATFDERREKLEMKQREKEKFKPHIRSLSRT
ncbi:hypothetical protein QJS10_CPA06g00549 [Acorus calamus]|uniref:Pseudouridine synthase I TruA alpha/beta domain-containing protein n=1 Tax=Acorus calamus TaxID=4465 RepID=A0AAV9EPJ4_ACOCL|nr:hypothetical protein QJS10_CPA06g00549 [Acorus calamus]